MHLRSVRSWAPGLVIAALVLFCILFSWTANPAFAADAAFQQWLTATWPEAQVLGVSRATFDAATRGLEPDLSLPDLAIPGRAQAPQRGQAEFVQTPADTIKIGGGLPNPTALYAAAVADAEVAASSMSLADSLG